MYDNVCSLRYIAGIRQGSQEEYAIAQIAVLVGASYGDVLPACQEVMKLARNKLYVTGKDMLAQLYLELASGLETDLVKTFNDARKTGTSL